MKLFVSRKKYDLLNKEYLILNNNYEELKYAYKDKDNEVLDLKSKNEHSYFEKFELENQISILDQEVKLYDKTVKELEEEVKNLKKANEDLAKLWNDANRKLWCNNESARQLRKLSENILASQRLDKSYLSSYIHDISLYVGGGVNLKLEPKDK